MQIVITRHSALVQLLIEKGLVNEGVEVISHATPDNVSGKDVIGILPNKLAALANTLTEIPLDITPELRGKELDIETLRKIAGAPVTYKITIV